MVKRTWCARVMFAAVLLTAAAASDGAHARQDYDAFEQLPRQEIAAQQIGWMFDSYQAFTDAVEKSRPLIIVFGDETSNLTLAFARKVAPCPHLNQLAGAATFAYGSPTADEMARRMAMHLQLTDYPTISVIAPRTDQLVEIYRLEGMFDAASIASDLYRVLRQSNYWPADRAPPAALPTHYLAYPDLACTPEGLRRLGLINQ